MNYKNTQRMLHFAVAFLLSLLICATVTVAYVRNKSQLEYAQMEHLVTIWSEKVNQTITKLLYKTEVLSALVIQSDGEIEDFQKTAATIMDDPSIKNVIAAPGGIVKQVYPLSGNEALVGFDFFSDKAGNKEAIAAKDAGQLVMGGPFQLVQGGQAIVGRLPVYIGGSTEDNFWGLVSITLDYPKALEGANLRELQNQGYAFELWRIDPDTDKRQIIASSEYSYNKSAAYLEKTLDLMNAEWHFRLSPIRIWYEYPETWIFTVLSLVISFLIASLIMHNYDLRIVKCALEEISQHDSLTGILNRRGIMRELEGLVKKRRNFVLCYLDLNKFKMINDTYGHDAGDRMLRLFAERVTDVLKIHYNFARIGGDEFILLLPGAEDRKEAEQTIKKIRNHLMEVPLELCEETITIMFSVGYAVYPKNGTMIDELLSFADGEMYHMKRKESRTNNG